MIRFVWLVAHSALVLLGVRVLDILLLLRHLDAPWVVARWLVAAFVLMLLLRRLAPHVPGPPDAGAKRLWLALDRPTLALAAFGLVLLFVFHWGFQRAGSDGREYFVQVRSLVIDRDLDFRNENAIFGVRGTADIYPFGAPLLWIPFFLLAHGWLGVLNLFGAALPRDGYASAYQQAIGLGTLVYGFAGLVLIDRLLRDYFSRALAAAATIGVCAGSFLAWYLAVESSMVHGVSMFATTLFLFLWHRTRADRTLDQWAALGGAAGLMAMVRWQNALFAFCPLADAIGEYGRGGPGRRGTRIRDAAWRHLAFTGCAVLAFLPQLVFWARARGGPLDIPAAEHHVQWLSAQVGQVLFSPNHGLFSWSPLLYAATAGAVIFLRRDRRLGTLLLVGLVAQVYVNAVVEVWWGGAGFGARRFANCALLFAVGLASLLDWLRRRPAVAPSGLLAALVAFNIFFMIDVRRGVLPSGESIRFDRMIASTYNRVGNPFSLPMSAWIAWRYEAPLAFYDRLGSQTFNTLRIDLGAPGDARFLVRGWSDRERAPGMSFRWSEGLESSVVAPLREPAVYRLELRCQPFTYDGAPAQVVSVVANGQPAGRLTLQAGLHDYRITLPARLMRRHLNEIRFRYRYARSPKAVGASEDARALGVLFDTITFLRQR